MPSLSIRFYRSWNWIACEQSLIVTLALKDDEVMVWYPDVTETVKEVSDYYDYVSTVIFPSAAIVINDLSGDKVYELAVTAQLVESVVVAVASIVGNVAPVLEV